MPPLKIALFNTTIIRSHVPFFAGQHPVFEQHYSEGTTRIYSSGKLEVALKRGFSPYVVTMMPEPYTIDRWWLELVPARQVFFTDQLLELFDAHRDFPRIALDPWRRCYKALGIPWQERFEKPDEAREHLIGNCGVTDGSSLNGFSTN